MPKILIVEDEIKIAQILADYLSQTHEVKLLHRGDEVAEYIAGQQPDLMLLDIMLPGKDGLEILKETRAEYDFPIIMLTARVEEIDRLLGLELGADDYVCKPFSPREVVARVKTVLRRFQPSSSQAANGITLHEHSLMATYNSSEIELSAVEFQLFNAMIQKPGMIFSRDQLMTKIYSDHRVVSHRTIDSHIKKLRKRLKEIHPDEIIHSVYGVGYKFERP